MDANRVWRGAVLGLAAVEIFFASDSNSPSPALRGATILLLSVSEGYIAWLVRGRAPMARVLVAATATTTWIIVGSLVLNEFRSGLTERNLDLLAAVGACVLVVWGSMRKVAQARVSLRLHRPSRLQLQTAVCAVLGVSLFGGALAYSDIAEGRWLRPTGASLFLDQISPTTIAVANEGTSTANYIVEISRSGSTFTYQFSLGADQVWDAPQTGLSGAGRATVTLYDAAHASQPMRHLTVNLPLSPAAPLGAP